MQHRPPDAPVRRRLIAQPPRLAMRPSPRPATLAPREAPEEPLLRLAAVCPRCGARPAVRATARMVEALASHPADAPVGSYQCQRRGCGHLYALVARDYHDAC